MNLVTLYELLRGPLLWLAFGVFFGGMVLRVILFYRLSKRKDGVIYRFFSWKWLWLSIFHWIIPLNETAKKNPVVTSVGFVFHICLIVTPL
ncbi:MAG: nitrate reductase, partial [Syntrophobacteria bacterium]